MKVVITSVYENVNQEWLDWYISLLKDTPRLPGCRSIAQELKESDKAMFKSKDPSSEVEATTYYEVVR